jgi:hypothetical protein
MSDWTPPGHEPYQWADKIVSFHRVDPEELLAPSVNPWIHSAAQQRALETVLDSVGWWDAVKVNINTGRVVDGSMRVLKALQKHQASVPVLYVDLTEDEERAALALHNRIAGMVILDSTALDDLLPELNASDLVMEAVDLGALLDELAASVNLFPLPPPKEGPPALDVLPAIPTPPRIEQRVLFDGPAADVAPARTNEETPMTTQQNQGKLPFAGGLGGEVRERPDDARIQAMMQALNGAVWLHGFGTTSLQIIEQQQANDWMPIKIVVELVQLDPDIAQLAVPELP